MGIFTQCSKKLEYYIQIINEKIIDVKETIFSLRIGD